ncbi:MAG: hypothetical protein PHQ47_00125 [Candidatus Portnoybacteria bacterium]|nr:hypothetical protein [Candidatus Portnoybacteria bacterium]
MPRYCENESVCVGPNCAAKDALLTVGAKLAERPDSAGKIAFFSYFQVVKEVAES